jgi:hypothetical protein
MTDKGVVDRLRELDRLYAEHAKNQGGESLKERNRLHLELSDSYTSLKPYIKKQTKLQWYEPVYSYAISGNLDYIAAVREDLAQITEHYAESISSES